jgi:PAS domain S-box-containing protein
MRKDDQPLSILVIEDNPGDFLLIDDYLLEKFSAIKVIHIKTFTSLITDLKSFESIDVVLLDLTLPDLKGETLVEKIQEYIDNIPIIILTGYSDIELARKALSRGISDFLIKDEINPEIIYKSIVYAIERKSYIAQLKKNKKVYQDLFNFSPQPMWIFDPITLSFLNVNKAAVLKYGYTIEEFKKMTIRDIRPKNQLEFLEKRLEERKREDPKTYAGIFIHTLKSGVNICVEIFSSEIEFEGRGVRLVLANDITEKQEYIETIETQNKKLMNIAWTQSHVVRSPLSRMLGIINLLDLEPRDSENVPFLLEQIKVSGNELDQIIRKIVSETNSIGI